MNPRQSSAQRSQLAQRAKSALSRAKAIAPDLTITESDNLIDQAAKLDPGYELPPERRAQLNRYRRAMGAELAKQENIDKGEWDEFTRDKAMNELFYHSAKLLKAVETLKEREALQRKYGAEGVLEARKAVLEFCADVGNCAMIVADVCDALETVEADLESAEEVISWLPY